MFCESNLYKFFFFISFYCCIILTMFTSLWKLLHQFLNPSKIDFNLNVNVHCYTCWRTSDRNILTMHAVVHAPSSMCAMLYVIFSPQTTYFTFVFYYNRLKSLIVHFWIQHLLTSFRDTVGVSFGDDLNHLLETRIFITSDRSWSNGSRRKMIF